MGIQQPATRSDNQPEAYRDSISDSGRMLEGADLLDCLESGHQASGNGDDSGDPVTGIAHGLIVGGLFWAITIGVYFIAT